MLVADFTHTHFRLCDFLCEDMAIFPSHIKGAPFGTLLFSLQYKLVPPLSVS